MQLVPIPRHYLKEVRFLYGNRFIGIIRICTEHSTFYVPTRRTRHEGRKNNYKKYLYKYGTFSWKNSLIIFAAGSNSLWRTWSGQILAEIHNNCLYTNAMTSVITILFSFQEQKTGIAAPGRAFQDNSLTYKRNIGFINIQKHR